MATTLLNCTGQTVTVIDGVAEPTQVAPLGVVTVADSAAGDYLSNLNQWSQITTNATAPTAWASGTTYSIAGWAVTGSDSNIYQSVQANTGHDPTTDSSHTYWRQVPAAGIQPTPPTPSTPVQNITTANASALLAGAFAGILTTVGPPTSGTWTAGQSVLDAAGNVYNCVVGGTPGTWKLSAAPAGWRQRDCPGVVPPVTNLPPGPPALTTATTGGTLAAATVYTYLVTYMVQGVESQPSQQVTVTTGAGSTNANTLGLGVLPSHVDSVRIYGRTGGSLGLLATVSNAANAANVFTWTDTGSGTPGAAPPAASANAVQFRFVQTGGTSPINGGSPTTVPYNTTTVTKLGCLPQPNSTFGYIENGVCPSSTGINPVPWAVEFDYTGADLCLIYREGGPATAGRFWVTVDGQAVHAGFVQEWGVSNSSGATYCRMRLTFPDSVQRRVRIYLFQVEFQGLEVGPTDTVQATPPPKFTAAVLGDSYTGGALGLDSRETYARHMTDYLGWEPYYCGIGGTGYVNTGPGYENVNYASTTRLAALVAAAPNAVVIVGSINDITYTQAQVQTNAAATISYIRQALPTVPIFVIGVQDNPASAGSGRTGANAGVQAAVAAAGANVYFIPWIGWTTGTGSANAPAGNGNADVMIGSDAVHPTAQYGHPYYGRQAGKAIRALLPA